MNTVRTFLKNADVKKIGVVSFYAYFAINILMKAFSYDHGDNIYKWFFYTAILFWDHSYDGNRSDAFCDHKTEYVAAVDHDGSGDEELPFFGDCTDRGLDPLCGGGDTVRWFPDRNF